MNNEKPITKPVTPKPAPPKPPAPTGNPGTRGNQPPKQR